jgi:hypothetical protein
MLRFFRQIRQRLITGNKFSKYLLYAIGEILLVVIGILIALQVNNWNEEVKAKALQINILNEISKNLQSDFEDHHQNIEFMEHTIFSSEVILNHLNNNLPYHDSLPGHFVWLAIIPDFYSTKSGYKLLSSKGIDLITKDSLRQDISYLYDSLYPGIEDWFAFLKANSYKILTENMVLKFYDFEALNSYTPRNYTALQQDNDFKSAVDYNMGYFRAFKNVYTEHLVLINTLIERIENEINSLK